MAIAGTCAQSVIVPGCNADKAPGPVRDMIIIPSRDARSMRVSWKSPANTECVKHYEVKVVESGANPKTLPAPIALKALAYSVKIDNTAPGAEYTVTITGFNNRGAGVPVRHIIKLTVPDPCTGGPPLGVANITVEAIDHKTLDVYWRTRDTCYDGAKVELYDAVTNKLAFSGRVQDTYIRITGLAANTRYRVVVTAFGRNPNDLATPASVYAETSCNVADPPGRPQPLKAQAISPPGTVELSIGGISNAACVESWEVITRGNNNSVIKQVEPLQGPGNSRATFKHRGQPGGSYTFAVTALGTNGKRGITTNIGPVLADGKTVLEAGSGRLFVIQFHIVIIIASAE
eukprot:gene2049-2371_t